MNDTPIPAFKVFGKPHPEPYRLMEGLLMQQAKLIGLDLPKSGGKLPFGAVYAVGDNPASDIAGARAAGTCRFMSVHPHLSIVPQSCGVLVSAAVMMTNHSLLPLSLRQGGSTA